jgi:DNA-binding XRE family transcriptional regulator
MRTHGDHGDSRYRHRCQQAIRDLRINAIVRPAPIHINADTVTFNRVKNEAYLATIAAVHAERDRLGDALSMRRYYNVDEAERMIGGTPAAAIWRARLGLTQKVLAERAGISGSYLAEIETGRKAGTAAVFAALARVFGVPMEMLVE